MPQATNNTDYLLLASNDVSIFFDNSFVTKTSLTTVSPGESFQTFLGIDPAVKVKKTPKRRLNVNPLDWSLQPSEPLRSWLCCFAVFVLC